MSGNGDLPGDYRYNILDAYSRTDFCLDVPADFRGYGFLRLSLCST